MKQLLFTFLFLLFSFSFTNLGAQIKGNHAIINVKNGKALRPINASKKDGANVIMYNPVNWKCMTWEFNHTEGNTYQLKNLFSSKTFHATGSEKKGATLEQVPFEKGNDRQYWIFEEVTDGIYKIRKSGTDLYLTPQDPNGSVNSNVQLLPYSDSDLQHWKLKEQHPTM